ncbi:MAG: V-type ATP synthase subunit E [Oscillospiraceae bacterium]|jgi:vacuolar-type H+-ATPase subunit E/Vma4|nr:V-type ATP synthase subunit E [Oscillospiraceae bacterium]
MLEQEERLNRFLAEIITEAEDRRSAIIAELRELREKERVQAEADAQKLREESVAAEEKRLAAAQNAAVSQEREELRKALSRKREELANRVLALAHEKLLAYTSRPGYAEFFARRAAELSDNFRGRVFTLYVRPEDLEKAQEILRGRDDCTAAVDQTILLGGCKLKCGSVTADDTLDARLDQLRAHVLAWISLPEI